MEPKPPQGKDLPIWIGGAAPAALRRVGELGDGWLATSQSSDDRIREAMDTIRQHAEAAGRDPAKLGYQMMLDAPPRDDAGKGFYRDHDLVFAAAERIQSLGFEWLAINMTAMFQAGARSVEAMVEQLGDLHDALHTRFD